MKFKKLTLAAAISIGLASVATVGAFADNAQQLASCGCGCAPVIVSPACPLEEPCACKPACDPCPACPVCAPECDKPACGISPSSCGKAKEGVMHYAYPQNIFSGCKGVKADPFNIGFATDNGVLSTKGCNCDSSASNCGCDCNSIPMTTGAACGCGSYEYEGMNTGASCMPCISNGAVVDRNCCSTKNDAPCGCAAPVKKSSCGCCETPASGSPIAIQTQSSLQITKKSLDPFQVPVTGCATPVAVSSVFCDVPEGFWANCDINKLVSKNVIAGYPDRTFKPTLPVSRAEFASLIANGLDLSRCCKTSCAAFCDVPGDHWANSAIQRAVGAGYMAGYPDNTFKPSIPVSRAEAITTIAKAFKCDVSSCDIEKVLSQYVDGCKVPDWAKSSVAKALNSGLLQETLTPNQIKPCEDASRADVASMLAQARVALCIDKPEATGCACDNKKTAYLEHEECVDLPTLKVKMKDRISSSSSDVGDQFAAQTIDPIVINGVTYPACSRVNGKIVDIQRPTSQCDGSMKIVLTEIKNGDCKAKLPRQILNAQVDKTKNPNWFIRTVEAPFTLVGTTLGIAGRTVGGIVVNAGNAAEAVTNGVGIGTGELFQAQFRAAGRSYQDSIKALAEAPVDVARTSLSGATGVLQSAGDQIGYLINPDGKCISSINLNERVTFAFDLQPKCACTTPCECPAAAAPCECPAPSPCACPTPCAPASDCCD